MANNEELHEGHVAKVLIVGDGRQRKLRELLSLAMTNDIKLEVLPFEGEKYKKVEIDKI